MRLSGPMYLITILRTDTSARARARAHTHTHTHTHSLTSHTRTLAYNCLSPTCTFTSSQENDCLLGVILTLRAFPILRWVLLAPFSLHAPTDASAVQRQRGQNLQIAQPRQKQCIKVKLFPFEGWKQSDNFASPTCFLQVIKHARLCVINTAIPCVAIKVHQLSSFICQLKKNIPANENVFHYLYSHNTKKPFFNSSLQISLTATLPEHAR